MVNTLRRRTIGDVLDSFCRARGEYHALMARGDDGAMPHLKTWLVKLSEEMLRLAQTQKSPAEGPESNDGASSTGVSVRGD